MYLTSEGARWTALDPPKMVPGGSGRPLKPPNGHFRGYLALFVPICPYLGIWLIVPNMVEWGVHERIVQNVVDVR